MNNENEKIREATKFVVRLLVAGEYDQLSRVSNHSRLSAEDMKLAVEGYGRQLALPPEEEFKKIDSVRISAANVPSWSVRFALWTIEEGKSDLSIEMTLYEQRTKMLKIEMDNIIVF